MDLPEVERFIGWWACQEKKGLEAIHYNFGLSGIMITDHEVTKLQLTVCGAQPISSAEAVALEAIFQRLNEINDAESLPPPSQDDVF